MNKSILKWSAIGLVSAAIVFAVSKELKNHSVKTNNNIASVQNLSPESRKNLDLAWAKYTKFAEGNVTRQKAAHIDAVITKKIEDNYKGVKERAEKDEAYKIGLLSSIHLLIKQGDELKAFTPPSKREHLTSLIKSREDSLSALKDKKADPKVIQAKEFELLRIKQILSSVKD